MAQRNNKVERGICQRIYLREIFIYMKQMKLMTLQNFVVVTVVVVIVENETNQRPKFIYGHSCYRRKTDK